MECRSTPLRVQTAGSLWGKQVFRLWFRNLRIWQASLAPAPPTAPRAAAPGRRQAHQSRTCSAGGGAADAAGGGTGGSPRLSRSASSSAADAAAATAAAVPESMSASEWAAWQRETMKRCWGSRYLYRTRCDHQKGLEFRDRTRCDHQKGLGFRAAGLCVCSQRVGCIIQLQVRQPGAASNPIPGP